MLVLLGVGVGVVVLVTTAIVGWPRQEPKPSSQSTAPARPLCQAQPTRDPCRELVVDGQVQRYEIRPAASHTATSVLVDFGGPGTSVLSGEWHLDKFEQAYPQLRAYNVIAVEEPWVTRPVSDTCRARLRGFYQALHGADASKVNTVSAALRTDCRVGDGSGNWGFTDRRYADAVHAIETKEHLSVVGFVGNSWGVVRLADLHRKLGFAVVVRPFPLGADADSLVGRRAAAVPQVPKSVLGLPARSVNGRSVPVNTVDRISAAIDLGYVADDELAAARSAVMTGSDDVLVGHLSDQSLRRYGVDDISPAFLAQLDEECPVIGATRTPLTGLGTAADLLSASLSPCAGVPTRRPTIVWPEQACLVTSATDTVTPGDLVRQQTPPGRDIQFVDSVQSAHTSFDGLDRCLHQIRTTG